MIPIYLAGFPEQYGQDTSLNFASLPLKHVSVVVPLPFGLLSRLLPVPSVDFLDRGRLRDEVALNGVDVHRLKRSLLIELLYAFGNNGAAKAVGDFNNHADELLGGMIPVKIIYKARIKLDEIRLELAVEPEGREPLAESAD